MNKQKDDNGKLRWDLLPLDVVEKLVEIYEFGANKYEENSWRTIENGYKRCRAALFRHLTSYDKGERVDPESGKSHLAHAAWNALSMVYFAEREQEKPILSQHITNELSRIAHEEAKRISEDFSTYDVLVWHNSIGRQYMCENNKNSYLYCCKTGSIISKFQGEITKPREARASERKVYYDAVNDYKERNV